MNLLSVERLDVRHGLLQAVREVSLEIDAGETVALVGANGAGKTTLLRAIAGAHRPHGGRISFDGADITSVPAHQRVRRGIALVPEGRRLFAELTLEENLRVAAGGRDGEWGLERVLEAITARQEAGIQAARLAPSTRKSVRTRPGRVSFTT